MTKDIPGQIALPTSDDPVAVITDLSEGLLYEFEVIHISVVHTNFIEIDTIYTVSHLL